MRMEMLASWLTTPSRRRPFFSSSLIETGAELWENNITDATILDDVRLKIVTRFSYGQNGFPYRMEVAFFSQWKICSKSV